MLNVSTLSISFALRMLPGVFCSAVLFSQACSTGSGSIQPFPRTPQASVSFEEVADWSFEAAHPAIIESATIQHVLQGLYISANPYTAQSSADGGKPMRAFSDEDAKYLAPLLAHALSQAQPEYVVAFRLSSSAGSGVEPTAGTLYVLDGRLHVTLTAFRGDLGRPAGAEPSMVGTPAVRRISFKEETISHVHLADSTVALGKQGLQTVAVDYSALGTPIGAAGTGTVSLPAVAAPARKPEPLLMASASDAPIAEAAPQAIQSDAGNRQDRESKEQELKEVQQALVKKDAKIDQLRRDLESMRQQLEAKDKELRQVKSKPAAVKQEKRRTAEVTVR